ncbi:MAG TPA: hypothetical protein PKY59_04310 [Pyrinomonadaceae bacterium]|nr:hypothetical protein [Pyrinomonadaceae bacterium]
MNEILEQTIEKETVVCMSCLAPNDAENDFCAECSAPISTTSTLDPLKTIRAEAVIFDKAATTSKPKFIILLGVWILFFPALIGSLFMIFTTVAMGSGFGGFLIFWIGVGLALISLILLFRVTRNYFAFKTEKIEENEELN